MERSPSIGAVMQPPLATLMRTLLFFFAPIRGVSLFMMVSEAPESRMAENSFTDKDTELVEVFRGSALDEITFAILRVSTRANKDAACLARGPEPEGAPPCGFPCLE